MITTGTISLLGLYNYDSTLFSKMKYPDSFSSDDKTTFIENLLAETANLTILYPNADFMKDMIGSWSSKQLRVWNDLYKTLQYEYNPIENYDRKEDGTNTYSNSHNDQGTADQYIAAYDSPENALAKSNEGHTETEASDRGSNTHTIRSHGNIGVTTTQEMIKQQREVVMFNIFDAMIDDFRKRFCILVY